eukprot:scaffold23722_cov25-Prasinocladus_malaysianus.AAC.1
MTASWIWSEKIMFYAQICLISGTRKVSIPERGMNKSNEGTKQTELITALGRDTKSGLTIKGPIRNESGRELTGAALRAGGSIGRDFRADSIFFTASIFFMRLRMKPLPLAA